MLMIFKFIINFKVIFVTDYTAGLRVLSLKGNDITSLSAEVFQGRLTQLSVLELQNNPFICDCNLTSFKTWIDSMVSICTSS